MSSNPSQTPSDIPVDEEQLSAFLDGELSPEESARLQSVLSNKVAETDRMTAWSQIGHDIRQAAQSFQSPESASAIIEQVRLEAAGAASVAPATHSTHDSISGQRRVIAVIAALALTVVCGVSLVLVNESRRDHDTPPLALNEADASGAFDESTLADGIENMGGESISGFAAPAESSLSVDAPMPERPTSSEPEAAESAAGATALTLSQPRFNFALVRVQVDNPALAIGHLHQSMDPNGLQLSMPDEVSELDDSVRRSDRVAVYFDADESKTRRLLADLFGDTEEFRSIDWEPVDLQVGTRDEIIHAVIEAIAKPSSPDNVFGRPFLVQTADGSEQIPGFREVASTLEIEKALTQNPIMDTPGQLSLAEGSPIAARSRQAPVDIPSRHVDREGARNFATGVDAQDPPPNDVPLRQLDESLVQQVQSGSLRRKLDFYFQQSPRSTEDSDSGGIGATTSMAGVVLLLETRSRQTEE